MLFQRVHGKISFERESTALSYSLNRNFRGDDQLAKKYEYF